MPTLLETQRALRRSLVGGDTTDAAAMLAAGVPTDRLDIYRNTFILTVVRTLRLGFPAVHKLVGADFFEGAAQLFLTAHPPRVAWLDRYGGAFPDFLRTFPPAQSLPYLADVARLEWAVSHALHAADVERLDPSQLATVAPDDQGRIRLTAEPSISLLHLACPADAIWRATLAGSDADFSAIDLASGDVHLLIERGPDGVDVTRLPAGQWRFLAALCVGEPIETAIDPACDFDVSAALAGHLVKGRFCAFELGPCRPESRA